MIDGVVFDPAHGKDETRRLAALVVAPELDARTIQDALREHVDSVFIPRPVVLVDALPRTESSKLPRSAVLEMFAALRGTS